MANMTKKGFQSTGFSGFSNEYISDKNARRAFQMGKRFVGDVATLANIAQGWKADPDRTDWAIADYLSDPNPYSFHLAGRKIFADAFDLPPDFVHLSYAIDDLIKLAAEGQHRGSDGELKEFLNNPRTLDALRSGRSKGSDGLPGAREAVLRPQTEKLFGIPPGLGLSVKDMEKGVQLAQERGLGDAVGSPEYWKDFKRMPTERLVKKHAAKLAQADAKKNAELQRKFEEYQQAKLSEDIDRELDRRRRQREKERKEKLRKRRMRRRKKKKIHAPTIRTIPIITPWGKYMIAIYPDGDTAIFKIKNGEINILLTKGDWAYNGYVDAAGNIYATPLIGRRTGQRRASPLQAPLKSRNTLDR